jgi:polyhydroxyalkanoate synthase
MPDSHPAAQLTAALAGGPTLVKADEMALLAQDIDRAWRAGLAKLTGGLSPGSIAGAYLDWAVHIAASPGRQALLGWQAMECFGRFAAYLANCAVSVGAGEPCVTPTPGDHRFTDAAWSKPPFNIYAQAFLLTEQFTLSTMDGVRGVSAPHQRIASFMTRQALDVIAPSNFPTTNPLVLEATIKEGGANMLRGLQNMLEDFAIGPGGLPKQRGNPQVGVSVAVTPGKVVHRSHLVELIQYAPLTDAVHPEPMLIVPAWIMKYYILDLSPHNSLVRYLVQNGFTVFMISWRNPGTEDRDLTMQDYLDALMQALAAARAIAGAPQLHAAGYCLGGTLLSIAAAAMARDGDTRLRSLTLFAAQQDFTEAGELTLFISESQIALLEDMMREQGFLDSRQMAGAFQMLRSNDLVWSHLIQAYLLGERQEPTDLMAWNADATRMPAAMHAEYLKKLFLDNDLAEGRFRAGAAPVAISDIRVPVFAVGTETDHVAPWRSVHKIHLLTEAEVTFVLTSGGHNAGIVSEPGHAGHHYLDLTRPEKSRYIAPESWQAQAERHDGSWWPAWVRFLTVRSGEKVPPPALSGDMNAPGTYVLQT